MGKYNIPKGMSILARDLLKNILVKQTEKRYKIKDIKTHPWMFYYLKDCQPEKKKEENKIEIIIGILRKQGYEEG